MKKRKIENGVRMQRESEVEKWIKKVVGVGIWGEKVQ